MRTCINGVCLFFVLGIVTCNTSIQKPTDPFKDLNTIYLQDEQVIVQYNDSIMGDPRSLLLQDSLAFCYDNLGETGYSLFNLKSGNLIKRFAYSGNQDHQFNINALSMSPIAGMNRKVLLFQENPPFRLFRYDIDSLRRIKNYEPPYIYQLPDNIFFDNLLMLNDSILVGKMGLSDFDHNFFAIFNRYRGKLITGVPLPNSTQRKYQKYYHKNVYSWTRATFGGDLKARPGNPRQFAYFSSKGAYIQLFNIDKNQTFKSIYQHLYYPPLFQVYRQSNQITYPVLLKDCLSGFNNITVTKDKIYALYNGKSAYDNDTQNLLADQILVYSWTGQPIERIQLNQPCYKIEIDPSDEKVLFCLRTFIEPSIVRYALP
jgi:hypothetical protein